MCAIDIQRFAWGKDSLGCTHGTCSHKLSISFQLKAQIKTEEQFPFVFNLIHRSHHQSIFIIRISHAYNCQPQLFFSLNLVQMAWTIPFVLILTMYSLGAPMNGRPLTFSKSNNKFNISLEELFLRLIIANVTPVLP